MRKSYARLPDNVNQCFDFVQQPRRFACDRCRLQKLRCERDIWRPTLMPCKRCRRANIGCTISTSAPTSRRCREKSLVPTETKENDGGRVVLQNEHYKVSSSGMATQDCPPLVDTCQEQVGQGLDNVPALDGQCAVFSTRQEPLKAEPVNDEYCSVNDFDLDISNMPFYSGLITPPSSDAEQEGQFSVSNMAVPGKEWPIELSQFHAEGLDLSYDGKGVFRPNREQMYCRSLLDLNIHFLDCQQSLSQGLAMPGSSTPATPMEISMTSLDYAVRTVLACSERFMNAVRSLGNDHPFEISVQCLASSDISARVALLGQPEMQLSAGIISGSPSEWQPGLLPPVEPSSSSFKRPRRWADMDAPTVIAALSCYTCLIGMYHLVLSYILQEVIVPSPLETRSTPAVRHPLAHSDRVQEPQLRMLFLTMTQMLGRIEHSIGFPETRRVALQADDGSRVASHPVAAALLDTHCGNGVGDRRNMVEEMIQTLRQYIEGV